MAVRNERIRRRRHTLGERALDFINYHLFVFADEFVFYRFIDVWICMKNVQGGADRFDKYDHFRFIQCFKLVVAVVTVYFHWVTRDFLFHYFKLLTQ